MSRSRRRLAPRHGSDLARFVAVSASAGAAEIHLVMSPVHWQEWWPSGLFFVVIGIFQAVWAVLALWRSEPVLMFLGAVLNLVSIGMWALSRLYGIPFGPHAWMPEPVGLADLVTVALEGGVVAGALWAVRGREARAESGKGVIGAVTVAALAVAFSTAAAVSDADEHSHGTEAEGHGGGAHEGAGMDASGGESQQCEDASETGTPSSSASSEPGDGHTDDGHDHEH